MATGTHAKLLLCFKCWNISIKELEWEGELWDIPSSRQSFPLPWIPYMHQFINIHELRISYVIPYLSFNDQNSHVVHVHIVVHLLRMICNPPPPPPKTITVCQALGIFLSNAWVTLFYIVLIKNMCTLGDNLLGPGLSLLINCPESCLTLPSFLMQLLFIHFWCNCCSSDHFYCTFIH